jgi:hypothetical protein
MSRLINVLSMRMVLTIHILPSERLKCDFCNFDEAMFHDVERPFERIYNILGIQKSNLNEIADFMFLVGESPENSKSAFCTY